MKVDGCLDSPDVNIIIDSNSILEVPQHLAQHSWKEVEE
jgi:hypothetical protein